MLKTEAVKAFLSAFAPADLSALYSADMEVQINVAKDEGERVEGDFKGKLWLGYTDGVQTWKPIRIPMFANTDPQFEDTRMTYDLAQHAEGIGMTGWDWKNRTSHWVAFDFDAIVGHSDKHAKKLSDEELSQIVESLRAVPAVTIRRSTGGKGLHLYVFVEPTPTANHNEHASVARAVLSQLSGLAGFDFGSKVDICGGNMWVWHRKIAGTNGLEIIKRGEGLFRVPDNWRDYVKVVSGRRPRNLPKFVEDQAGDKPDVEDVFAELTGQRLRVRPDADHKKLMNWLFENYPSAAWWDAENHMLVTHTHLLKLAHETLQMRGKFETLAQGTEKGYDQNCFSGDTMVLTKYGEISMLDLADVGHAELYVWTPEGMKWIDCPIRSFGIQKTWSVKFGDGSVVRATPDHDWIVEFDLSHKIKTWEISEGKTELSIASRTLPEVSEEGYAHGFVFGDGWLQNTRGKVTSLVSLFKRDVDLQKLLLKFGTLGSQHYLGHGYVNTIRQLPDEWKDLPIDPTPEYALGFILGLVSADGYVTTNTLIVQSDLEVMEAIRKLAIYAGLRPYPVRKYGDPDSDYGYPNAKQCYALTISNYNLTPDHFLRSDHKAKFVKREKHTCMTASSIDRDEREEEVFCATVPFYQNFTLANLVVTGNCYMFPMMRGSWSVRRFSLGVTEHPFWEQDGSGWTRCFYNQDLTLSGAARIYGGLEDSKGAFHFGSACDAAKAAILLGAELGLPTRLDSRKTKMMLDKTGKLVVHVARENSDGPVEGWIPEAKRFEKIFAIRKAGPAESEAQKFDDTIRHLVTEAATDAGWVIKGEGVWNQEPFQSVKMMLTGMGFKSGEVAAVMSSNIRQYWTLVNKPFKEEYPKDRQWNRYAPQLKFKPTLDRDNLNYPTWLSVLNHCGENLNESVAENEWCRAAGIATGADWLKCWIASLIQEPCEPLPYLFFYSTEQDTGKSIFHEALAELITNGVVRADVALTSPSGFNGELANSVLCVVEETDLRTSKLAYNRIKDWVTSRMLPVHKKHGQPYLMLNTTHWVQCANTHLACPVFQGDTRITMIKVSTIKPEHQIPKKLLMPMLIAEAPDFLADILALELPKSNDRLNIPCLHTADKIKAGEDNQSDLEFFLSEYCHYAPGHAVKYDTLWNLFYEKLDANQASRWTKQRMGKELPTQFVKGRLKASGQYYIGNISLTPVEESMFGRKIYVTSTNFLWMSEIDTPYQENPK